MADHQRTRTLLERPLGVYLDALASGSPAPGGGSAVAVAASLATALGAMVARLTAARRPGEPDTDRLTATAGQLDATRLRLVELATDDEAAYSEYIAATRLPKGTDAEREARTAAQQDALHVAADVPLATVQECVSVLDVLGEIAGVGPKHALADCAVGAWLAAAAGRGALLNVRTNAGMMKDERRRAAYLARADELDVAITDHERRVHRIIADRAG